MEVDLRIHTFYPNLAAGTYNIIVQDVNGCTFNSSTTVGNSNGPTAAVVTSTGTDCGQSNGSITIGAVTGGVAPYTYRLSGTPGFTTLTVFPNLAAGPYTIDVKDANGCIFTAPATINNLNSITPTFTQIGPLCQNSAAPALPGTSIEGITGTWAPAVISTTTLGATTYTFTPAAGQCGTTATMTINVTTQVTPTFTQIGPSHPLPELCCSALPGTSIEGITGTWAPAVISTTTLGATTYTFTPAAGQCGTTATMSITVATQITPTFTQIGPLCQNSAAPALPGTSIEGITGTWAPAVISTTTLGATTYTFTPAAGQCGTTATMSITVATQITPTFTQIGPLCQNSAAPALPGTSIEGITGTWAPAVISTTTLGATTYTFTPAAGQCGTTATMSITVATQITPTFTQIGPLCQNSAAPALPGTSIEGITGTWAPAVISTTTLGATTYTFTPAAGQCGTTATMSITVATQITPTFTQIGPLCQNSAAPALPGTSIEGITGTWAPAVISTTTLVQQHIHLHQQRVSAERLQL